MGPNDIRKLLIQDFIYHCSDAIPYSDPNYDEKLLEYAEHYADEMMDPNSELNQLCEWHDKYLEEHDFQ